MTYTPEIINKMVIFGALRHPLHRVISILEPEDVAAFTRDFHNPESAIRIAYKQGADKALFNMQVKMYEKAKDGDLEAQAALEKSIENLNITDLIYDRFRV